MLTAVVAALAVVLDRAAGPGAAGRSGVVVRGTAVGVLGTATVLVLAWAAIRADVDSVLPVGLRYAAAGLLLAAVAGLQWPGAVRVLTALAVVGSVAVVAVRGPQRRGGRRRPTRWGPRPAPPPARGSPRWTASAAGRRSTPAPTCCGPAACQPVVGEPAGGTGE